MNIGQQTFILSDGCISVYNNPSFLLFLMATLEPYQLEWRADEDELLLVSVGTGISPGAEPEDQPEEMNILQNITRIPSTLMLSAAIEQDFLCRVFGKCLAGDMLTVRSMT